MATEMRKENITPSKAAEYLKANRSNRPVNRKHVERLARAISNGEWLINGESIKWNCSDLIDGQHRLLAVIMANKPIETYVVRGLQDAAFDSLDQGKSRSLGDILARSGVKHYSTVASAVKWLAWLSRENNQTNAELHDFVEKNPAIHDSVQFITEFRDLKFSRGMFSALHFSFSLKDADLANQFMSYVLGGERLTKEMAEYKLRQLLISDAKSSRQYHSSDIVSLVIKTWNYVRLGKPLRCLKLSQGEARQEIS